MDHRDEGDTDLDTSVTRSGRARIPKEDVGCQTKIDYQSVPQPKVRLIRDCTPEVKTACVKVSVRCGISTAMAPVVVQIVTEEMYRHKYYLTKEEAIEKDPALAMYRQRMMIRGCH